MLLAGTIFGLLTLFSAVGAVLYARRAAVAAEKDLSVSQDVAAAELRPWIKIELIVTQFQADSTGFDIGYELVFTNIGQTIAKCFTFKTDSDFIRMNPEIIEAEYAKWKEPPETSERFALIPEEQRRYPGLHSRMKSGMPWHDAGSRKSISFIAIASAFYWSALDEKWHRTDRSFLVGCKGGGFNAGYFLYEDMVGEGVDMVVARPFLAGETT